MNLLIITTDQQRIDSLGTYGSPLCRTPALDQLTASGTRFDQAYSVCALCSPARASWHTGIYPHRHGIVTNGREFNEGVQLVSEDLTAAGYRCGFVGKWHCGNEKLPRDFGFEGMNLPGYGDCGQSLEYQEYLRRNGLAQGSIEPEGAGFYESILLSGVTTGPVEATVPYFVAEQTIEMLDAYAQDNNPFAIFANFWGPHPPYVPCEPFASMYDSEKIAAWGNFDDTLESKPHAHRRYRDSFLGEGTLRTWEEWSTWVARYFGTVTMIDAQIGRIMAALDRLGLTQDTAVLFTTDHGDHIGAHGGIFDKDAMMYQETYHIPFILRLPGLEGGGTINQPITSLDIAPTLLDLAGIDPGRPLDGRSLVPLLADGIADWEPDVYCVFNGHYLSYQSRMVTDGSYKYVFNAPDIDELYDLEADPWEMRNLIAQPEHRQVLHDMRLRLLTWAERTQDPLLGNLKDLFARRQQVEPEAFTPWPGRWRSQH
ncbi:MAG: sulfatase-like hydrolase/transferase [Anaerolineae bacterium]|jgi:arylsulfatase A-like enzyme